MFTCGICGVWLAAETVADHMEACIPAAPPAALVPAPAHSPGIIDATATTQEGNKKLHRFTPDEAAKSASALSDPGNAMPSLLVLIRLSKELGVSKDRIWNYYDNVLRQSQQRKAALKATKENGIPMSTVIGIFKAACEKKHDIAPDSRSS